MVTNKERREVAKRPEEHKQLMAIMLQVDGRGELSWLV